MENRNIGLKVIIIILVVALIACITFIVWDKLIYKSKIDISDINDNTSMLENKKENIEENLNSQEVLVENNKKTDSIQKESNDYKIFANNLKNSLKNISGSMMYYANGGYFFTGQYSITLEKEGTLYVDYTNTSLKNELGKIKIAENVLNFDVIETAQGGGHTLFFIKEDGTVGKAEVEYRASNFKTNGIVQDLGLKNIVSMIPVKSGLATVYFVDINGNIYSL